jgi:hypothetical protein
MPDPSKPVNSPAQSPLQQAWLDYFSCRHDQLPRGDLEGIAREALRQVRVCRGTAPSSELQAFMSTAGSLEHLLSIARLREKALFPSVYGSENGTIVNSRVIGNWNILLIEEQRKKMIIFQGVSCCDAILIPSENLLLIICHIEPAMVANSVAILCRHYDYFKTPLSRRLFGGYLVGHSRPYHCLYDSLLGLEAIRGAEQFSTSNLLISRQGESFFPLDQCLELNQKHLILNTEEINQLCDANELFLLYAGFWVKEAGEGSINRLLAERLDNKLLNAARSHSIIDQDGGLTALAKCRPLIWIGITGQKRSWIEQVDGIAAILNQLVQVYPSMGIIFDGWTSPMTPDVYHKRETRNDCRVIGKICSKLHLTKSNKIGVIAGLPLLEKTRVGLEVDAFITNYTTGSMNIARICRRPGVGHMSKKMMATRGPHIHYQTLEVDPNWIVDEQDSEKPTGYINYSIPWQAIYNAFIPILTSLEIPQSKPLYPVALPQIANAS